MVDQELADLRDTECPNCNAGILRQQDDRSLLCNNKECLAVLGDTWETEDYIGDELDGCYVRVYELVNGKYHAEVIVDSDTGSFVDTLGHTSECDTAGEAREAGKWLAIEWCLENQVAFDEISE